MTEQEYMTPPELARKIRCTVRTLQRWRKTGKGPRVTRVEGRVKYATGDVDEWLRAGQDQAAADA